MSEMEEENKGKVTVTKDDFKIDDLKDRVWTTDDGAVVVFNGVVRSKNDGQKVEKLEMQRYEGMTESELEKVKEEAINNFKISDVFLIHRYGVFDVGDNIVGIVVSAPHRDEAFDACSYCIDRIKEKVPLWKKETVESGESKWLGGENGD